jgi:hypothetical protein
MVHAAGMIATAGMLLRKHDVEPVSRAKVLSQDQTPFYLLISAGLR